MSDEAVVSSFAERLGDLLIEEAPLLYGVRDSLEWIRRELKSMQSFLKDAESKQKEDAKVKNWLAQIREVCYEAEDVIDTILSQREKKRDGFAGRVKGPMFLREIRTRHKLGEQIEKIKQKISDIQKKTADYGIRDISEGRQEASSSSQNLQERRRSSALLQETEVVGQRDEINSVKKQLMSDEPRRCVISIFGMGGSGKTTIARKVYHDVKNDFDCHAFICLSQQYQMKDVLIRLITCAMGKLRGDIENLTGEELEVMLREHLKGKRYLVVIDDIWSIEAWDKLKLILPDTGESKSRVLLTTRSKDVALHADLSGHHHEMRLLNEDASWELFMKKIFPGGTPSTTAFPAELEETGRKILAKCGGLPLAILVVGGLLSIKDKKFDAWSKVLESFQELYGSFDLLWRILAFSYWDLPYYLKPCFLYLGLFPEDSEIGSGRLIRLWIAEGFIEQKGNQIMEEVAEDYLEELVLRSMIQVTSTRSNDSIKTCRIHDLLRHFSISEARQNNFFAIDSVEDISSSLTNARRLALHNSIHGYLTTNHSTASLRSLLCFLRSEVPLSDGKLLRVLVVGGAEFTKMQLPKEVGEFVHLRYLELATIKGESLPSSIGNLSSLQTLKLSLNGTLPNEIWNLVELRHLSAYNFSTDGRPKLQNLRKLQTLCLMAGRWIEDGLGKLSNLRKLGICGDLGSHQEALSHSIDKLTNLRSLKLRDGHSIPVFSFTHHLHLYKMYLDGRIDKLPSFPPKLTELTLQRSLLKPDVRLRELPNGVIPRYLDTSVKE